MQGGQGVLAAEQSRSTTSTATGKHGPIRALRSGRVVGCPVDETTLLIIGLGRVMAGEVVVAVDGDQAGTRRAFVSNWRLATPRRGPGRVSRRSFRQKVRTGR